MTDLERSKLHEEIEAILAEGPAGDADGEGSFEEEENDDVNDVDEPSRPRYFTRSAGSHLSLLDLRFLLTGRTTDTK